jgi:class 3 adenylate cyclase
VNVDTLLIVMISVVGGLACIALLLLIIRLFGQMMHERNIRGEDVARVTGDVAKTTTRAVIRASRELRDQGFKSSMRGSIQAIATWAEAERPILRPASAPDGTATLLFSDIEGSSAMNERLGDERWLELLRTHNRIVREQIQKHGGFEVKSQGDGFMVAFASARRALDCATDVQRGIAGYDQDHPDEWVRVRIGIHTGETLRDRGDFYGKNVTMAARIADRAEGGEILVSSVVKELAENSGDLQFEDGFETELKGLSGEHQLYHVSWQAQEVATSA